ncbi:MAG: PAS domain S-box protein [Methanocalculus sp. MSAO_Arc1]|uniref:PAS domain-containing sensor histidine kinase n=1 Tax=Methanocalculus TaxID=71151 RepID=UPI000FED94C6|nr:MULTISPECIES: ATP-binding protein [unclassified Methanocalculus]MCP1661400.1 PAS domain S-box-containing protein [Methanocalculus sp. AMF5]RQD79706.1 MAG: PAS domain S-box protein [Methanocalculus sp. MSAO_Arc1]
MGTDAIGRDILRFSDALPVGICVIGWDRRIILWNRTLADWSGKKSEETIGLLLDEIYPNLKRPSYQTRIDQVLNGGPPAVFSSQLHPSLFDCRHPDGTPRVQQTSIIRYPGGDPDTVSALIIIEDVTELDQEIRSARNMRDQALRLAGERKAAEESLEQLNAKLHLLSSVTRHDILNKVMVIDGFLGFAEEMATDPTLAEYLEHVRAAAMIIQNILLFNREYEKIGQSDPAWLSIEAQVQEIEPGDIPVSCDCPGISVHADPMLRKVFSNLYDNTLRHADGATHVRVACQRTGSGLVITWEDDGPGIPDDDKADVFNRGFGRNTGLGLFLIREILSITGIAISETGTPGEGVRFELLVPEGGFRYD